MRSIAIVLTLIVSAWLPKASAIEFYPILQPNSTYVADTVLMSLASIPDESSVSVLEQNPQTITFESAVTKFNVPAQWETWGSPPNTESSTPNILYHTSISQMQMSLSLPSRTFGFELQGANPDVSSEFVVKFFDGATEIGSITRTVNGNAGALLFAGYSLTNTFNRITIDNPSGDSAGWALANIRYSTTAVPEPSTYALGVIATVVLGSIARRNRTRAKVSPEA